MARSAPQPGPVRAPVRADRHKAVGVRCHIWEARPSLPDTLLNLTSTLSPRPSPVAMSRQFVIATVIVMLMHAALLFGVPRFSQVIRAGHNSGTFVTRLVTPPTSTAMPESAPEASPSETSPAPQAAKPIFKPATSTARRPSNRASPTPKQPEPVADSEPAATASIQLPVTAAEAAAALEFARQLGDARLRLPVAADLLYRTQGVINGHAIDQSTTLQWRHDGPLYEMRWSSEHPSPGVPMRYAVGVLSPAGLVPVLAKVEAAETQDMRFDYAKQQIHLGAASTEVPLQPGTQDQLSALIQLGAMIAGDPDRYAKGDAIEFPAVFPWGTGTWHFVIEGTEELNVLHGVTQPAMRLVHSAQDSRDSRIEVWLGSTMGYFPLRVRVEMSNGDKLEYVIQTARSQPNSMTTPPSPRNPPTAASQ